jgi:hypothetical protein
MGSDARVVMAALADSIAAGVDSLIVFNPLNWKRDGEVPIDLDKGMDIADRGTKEPVSYMVVHEGPNELPRCGFSCSGCSAGGIQGLPTPRRAHGAAGVTNYNLDGRLILQSI